MQKYIQLTGIYTVLVSFTKFYTPLFNLLICGLGRLIYHC